MSNEAMSNETVLINKTPNATMKNATVVYYGPSYSKFLTVGSVSKGESVYVWWREDYWYYIQYTVDGTGEKKCGYVYINDVNLIDEHIPNIADEVKSNLSLGPVKIKNGGPTYLGPGTDYVQAGGVDKGEEVYIVTGVSAYSWKLIQYKVNGENKEKRAWVSSYVL